ncbi:AAA family ATPase [Nocardioides sp. 1609]|uniref:AAA family ATPase n=1 Tax=Nocardioides sp. 1609 TaxID=2508327 RepID=UPI00143029FA|nr:AAA family ATPase [Nocardioides sp. 1609]
MSYTNPNAHQLIIRAAGGETTYAWTRDLTDDVLPNIDVDDLLLRVNTELASHHIVYPNQDALVRRCLTGLLVGHVILQGPPGTGKTTLARALANAFEVHLHPSTATSEWSPFHVVGGLRPTNDGGLSPALGVVPYAVLNCAELTRAHLEGTTGSAPVGTWLLIDEFNRADIDKAIGSLYTLLSSCEPAHLRDTPIDLWFEDNDPNRQLWVPARFRIIGTMNDLDTGYVSGMSQGLRRRFQFITVGVSDEGATDADPTTQELQSALAGARASLENTYAMTIADSADLTQALQRLQRVVDGLRRPKSGVAGWPVGTAQIVDVLKSYLLSGPENTHSLDEAVTQRLVGQMTMISQGQFETFQTLLTSESLTLAAQELAHLFRPYVVT